METEQKAFTISLANFTLLDNHIRQIQEVFFYPNFFFFFSFSYLFVFSFRKISRLSRQF